ncbi:hypothetical protein [Adhaeribacter soli]|uniref:Uncharacterized protein n=1 Tax=Adhaeribacter soli TaxID=2607655 RepID=A0A5N1IX71_9BACT|nr:hypothetical protein [Adhaeribacter soli]KAA9338841.1 hypothetical protein F0P94_08590 [Adhaeribacter soli]
MIHESFYWKEELYKSYLTVAKFRHLKSVSEKSLVKLEKALLMGAYIIRKLDEAQKIPPDFLLNKEILSFRSKKDTVVDHLNWHRFEKHYDFDKVFKVEKDWRFILNQLIHSFSLIYSTDDTDKFDGILINSDQTKKVGIFFLPLKTLLTIFLSISEGDITDAYYKREININGSDEKSKVSELKLVKAIYLYPNGFNVDKIVTQTLNGEIYKRLF